MCMMCIMYINVKFFISSPGITSLRLLVQQRYSRLYFVSGSVTPQQSLKCLLIMSTECFIVMFMDSFVYMLRQIANFDSERT